MISNRSVLKRFEKLIDKDKELQKYPAGKKDVSVRFNGMKGLRKPLKFVLTRV